jgi:hypothetical protein
MTDLEQLKEQICGKEPVESDFPDTATGYERYLSRHADWRIISGVFDRTATAMNSKPSLNGCEDIEKLAEHQYPYDNPAHYGPITYEKHKWEVDARRQDFRMGAAAMLDLVKGMVLTIPEVMASTEQHLFKIRGHNEAIEELLAEIQSIQNNDNGSIHIPE